MEPNASLASHPTHPWLGIDIGGANLKAAHTHGWTNAVAFPMWKRHDLLSLALASMLDSSPPFVGVALTMTGELADCFESREHGVASILEQVTRILPASMIQVYGVDRLWRSVSQSARDPWMTAASNWHALATWVQRFVPNRSVLVMDIGSTTTDIIPIRDGKVAIDATTDSQRLQCGALVYTGIERSNVVGIVHHVPLFGKPCPVMNESFATTRDVYLWLEDVPEFPGDCETADGKPATRSAARNRLARVVGEDGATLTDLEISHIAHAVHQAQSEMIARAIDQLCSDLGSPSRANRTSKGGKGSPKSSRRECPFDTVLLSGHGDFLLDAALHVLQWDCPRWSLRERLGESASRCAPALAVATLAAEMIEDGE